MGDLIRCPKCGEGKTHLTEDRRRDHCVSCGHEWGDYAPPTPAFPAQSSPPHPTISLQVWVDVDEGIAEAVRWLNTIPGLRTLTSCQGGETYPAYVMATWTDAARAMVEPHFTVKLEGDGWGYLYPKSAPFSTGGPDAT